MSAREPPIPSGEDADVAPREALAADALHLRPLDAEQLRLERDVEVADLVTARRPRTRRFHSDGVARPRPCECRFDAKCVREE